METGRVKKVEWQNFISFKKNSEKINMEKNGLHFVAV